MANHDTVSIQRSTKGAVSDFLETEGFESIPAIKLVCYLCGALQRYEEEGQLLEPKIVFTHSIEEFSRAIPGAKYINIGRIPFDDRAGKKILKECATLAQGGWHIFCQPGGDHIAFGVFSANESPTSLSLAEILETEAAVPGRPNSILIERVHAKEVLVRSSTENTLTIAFSTSNENAYDIKAIISFADGCTNSRNDKEFSSYVRQLLIRVLSSCHGTILVSIEDGADLDALGLSPGIVLEEPIEIYPSFDAYNKSASSDGVLELQRIESLLRGFTSSDGIVLFSETGNLLGYRLLFELPEGSPEPPEAIGGSRRKAYEGIKMLLGANLKGVLFRSQDGIVECERA